MTRAEMIPQIRWNACPNDDVDLRHTPKNRFLSMAPGTGPAFVPARREIRNSHGNRYTQRGHLGLR
jgi:hypothetical protein